MSNLDWTKIAPKPKDQLALTQAWKAGGLPHIPWLNGQPLFPENIDMERVQQIAEPSTQAAPAPKPHRRTRKPK
jgi:hypothetical protein